MSAFKRDVLRTAIRHSILVRGGSVVGCEHDDGVFRDARFFQRQHHLADTPVQFLHHVATDTILRRTFELFASLKRCVRIVVRVVQKEWLF